MKYADKIERKINKMVEGSEAAKANIQAKMKKAEADRIEAQNEIDAAADTNDDVAYHKAKDKIRFADDTIEMCNNRLKVLNVSLCSEQEHEETIREIHAETEKAERDAEKKAAALVKELHKIADELNRTIDESNRLLEKWCILVHKDNQPPKYYSKNASEILYLDKVINRRKSAKKDLQDAGMTSLSIYDSIND